MSITAAMTTRSLRSIVYPALKAQGFDEWTSRKTWRRRGGAIQHVEFRSCNVADAERFGCTSASVSVWLGMSLPGIAFHTTVKDGQHGPRPAESQFLVRAELAPRSARAVKYGPKIWQVETPDHASLAARDIADQFQDFALGWLGKDWNMNEMLAVLIAVEHPPVIETRAHGAQLWVDAGTLGSPHRARMIADLAAATGDFALAAVQYDLARLARDHATGQYVNYLPAAEDLKLKALASACRAKA